MSKEWWDQEYSAGKNLPSSRTDHPSRSLTWYTEHYPHPVLPGTTALDVGCGKGRNSMYLARNGYSVTATETSTVALNIAQVQARNAHLQDPITFLHHDASLPLPLPDQSINLVVDMMVLHLLTKSQRLVYAAEVQRLLKPDGHYLVYTIFAGSPAAEVLFKDHPGPEPHSYIIPQSGVFEKAFSHSDLQNLFPSLTPVTLETKTEFSQAFGDRYERMYIHALLQKPQGK